MYMRSSAFIARSPPPNGGGEQHQPNGGGERAVAARPGTPGATDTTWPARTAPTRDRAPARGWHPTTSNTRRSPPASYCGSSAPPSSASYRTTTQRETDHTPRQRYADHRLLALIPGLLRHQPHQDLAAIAGQIQHQR